MQYLVEVALYLEHSVGIHQKGQAVLQMSDEKLRACLDFENGELKKMITVEALNELGEKNIEIVMDNKKAQ